MTWTPIDCHAHTTWSDGDLDLEAFVARVAARDVRPSVSDHVSRDVAGSIKSLERLGAYLEALTSHDVARSAEFCWHDGLWREVGPELHQRFSHRIGSLHAIWLGDGTLVRAFSRRWPAGLTPTAYIDAHLDNLERAAAQMPVEILAHPTLVPVMLRTTPGEELWSEAQEERLAATLARAGIAFELSARYPPHERLVRRVLAHGVRLSLGSDGHRDDQVGNLALPLALARTCGVADHELYDPHVHGKRS